MLPPPPAFPSPHGWRASGERRGERTVPRRRGNPRPLVATPTSPPSSNEQLVSHPSSPPSLPITRADPCQQLRLVAAGGPPFSRHRGSLLPLSLSLFHPRALSLPAPAGKRDRHAPERSTPPVPVLVTCFFAAFQSERRGREEKGTQPLSVLPPRPPRRSRRRPFRFGRPRQGTLAAAVRGIERGASGDRLAGLGHPDWGGHSTRGAREAIFRLVSLRNTHTSSASSLSFSERRYVPPPAFL